jgi:hypothetical protein
MRCRAHYGGRAAWPAPGNADERTGLAGQRHGTAAEWPGRPAGQRGPAAAEVGNPGTGGRRGGRGVGEPAPALAAMAEGRASARRAGAGARRDGRGRVFMAGRAGTTSGRASCTLAAVAARRPCGRDVGRRPAGRAAAAVRPTSVA